METTELVEEKHQTWSNKTWDKSMYQKKFIRENQTVVYKNTDVKLKQ